MTIGWMMMKKIEVTPSGAIISPNRMTSQGMVRQRAREPLSSMDEAPEPASAEVRQDPILVRRLAAAVATLAPTARSVVLLRYQDDLDPTDIARVLDMPLNTVKSHLKRSLVALRRQWIGNRE